MKPITQHPKTKHWLVWRRNQTVEKVFHPDDEAEARLYARDKKSWLEMKRQQSAARFNYSIQR